MVTIPDVLFFQEGPGVRKSQFTNKGVKLLNVGNINNNKINLGTTEKYISEEEAYKRYSHFLVDDGDLLIACSGIVVNNFHNKISFINKSDLPLCLNTSTMRFKSLDENKLHINFFYYFLMTTNFKKQIGQLITGSAQLNFGPSHIKKIKLPLPILEKQKEIASVLDKAQELVSLRKESIKKLEELSKSIFIDMFGNQNTNPFNLKIAKFADTILIDAPMVQPNTTEFENLLHIGPDRIEKNTGKILPALTAKEERVMSKKFLFNDTHILYSKIRPYLNKVAIADFQGLCSADMYPVRPVKDKLNKIFLWKLLLSKYFLKYTESLPDRASIPKLNRKEFANFEFPLPPMELQNKFAKIIEKIEEQKSLYEEELEKLEENFKALLQKSFN